MTAGAVSRSPRRAPAGDRTPHSAVWLLIGEGLIVPTGIVTMAYLTRRLGPDGYGLYTLAATFVVWVEFAISSFFSRTVVRFVASADDPQAVATTAYRVRFAVDGLVLLAIWLSAPAIARFFDEPSMVWMVRLFAVDIPLFGRAVTQRDILIGLGRHRRAGVCLSGRWIVRLTLVVILVETGWSIHGAILASLGASIVEAMCNRPGIGGWFARSPALPVRRLVGFAIPLFVASILMMLFSRLDLVMVKALGATASQAGAFAAAQNVALVLGVISPAVAPVLLSVLSRQRARGETEAARTTAQTGLRIIALAAPVVALVAAAAPEIVPFVMGPGFEQAIPVLQILALATLAKMGILIPSAALAAAGRPRLVMALTIPIPVVATLGHLVVVPRWGLPGAASVTAATAAIAGLVFATWSARVWRSPIPVASLARCAAVAAAVASAVVVWPAPGFWLVLKLGILGLATVGLLLLIAEITPEEIRTAASAVFHQRTSHHSSDEHPDSVVPGGRTGKSSGIDEGHTLRP